MTDDVLWRARHLRLFAFAQLASVGVVVVAGDMHRGRATVSSQISLLVVALVGAIASGVANALWLMRARSVIGARVRTIPVPDRAAYPVPAEAGERLVLVPGLELFHRESCVLVVGRSVRTVRAPSVEQRTPCGVCNP